MDYSTSNPSETNSLNIAARNNDIDSVQRLLQTNNPNLTDNRGWTCLHEAAGNDSYESLMLILQHPDCRHLCETFEGHTALYVACQKGSSIKTIKALIDHDPEIVNYASTEMTTPLHLASMQGRSDVVQLLLDSGAYIDVQDFDGDTALHAAAFNMRPEAIAQLIHAGADPLIPNGAKYTPFHLACLKDCLDSVKQLSPFMDDLNLLSRYKETPMMLAARTGMTDIVRYLLENGANPNLKNEFGDLALVHALENGHSDLFKLLLQYTSMSEIKYDIILHACKPHFFKLDILSTLLESDLGHEYFNVGEDFYSNIEVFGRGRSYLLNPPLNSFLHVAEYLYNLSVELFERLFFLFLMRGASVNALTSDDCPPLVYLHLCENRNCFSHVLKILLEHGCDVDYCSFMPHPDVIMVSLVTGGRTIRELVPYSLKFDPDSLVFTSDETVLQLFLPNVHQQLLSLTDVANEGYTPDMIGSYVPALRHIVRIKIRQILRETQRAGDTRTFIATVNSLPLPRVLKDFLRFL